MARSGDKASAGNAARITVRHINPWIQNRHVAAFLRPLVDGVRRLVASNKVPPSGAR